MVWMSIMPAQKSKIAYLPGVVEAWLSDLKGTFGHRSRPRPSPCRQTRWDHHSTPEVRPFVGWDV